MGDMEERTTRERILDVALDLFVTQGYDKASLREIAERMGFTKAALYYHFASKSDLLMALHERVHHVLDEPLAELGNERPTLEAWERFLDKCIECMGTNRKLFLMQQLNQATLAEAHTKAHVDQHFDLEERARRLFADQTRPANERAKMAASFVVAFVTPMLAGRLFPEDELQELSATLREAVHTILH
jgi:AcrR family transcriptional regulator